MKTVQTTVATRRTPEDVYAYLADFTHQAEWRFDVLTSELISGEPGQVGARYLQRVRPGRKQSESEVEVTEADRPSEVAFRTLDRGPVTVRGAWHIRSAPSGTEVVCDVAIETKGVLKLFEPLMGPQLRKIAARYESDLSERLNA
ncbi:SRPBCC family protein [Saccharothrix sp. AJ9571]|nr:SRPBCC family protein [Saccharothrix sp. AJ9571]